MRWIKLLAVIIPFGLSACIVQAQERYPTKARFSVGLHGGLPLGKLSDSHTIAFGGSLQETIPVNNALNITINTGYTKFKGKNNVDNTAPNEILIDYPDIDMPAAKAGLRYFFYPKIYLQADAGIALVLNSPQTSYDAARAFIYSPQIGMEIPVGKKALSIWH